MHRFIVAILLLAAPHGAFAATGELFAAPNFIPLQSRCRHRLGLGQQ